MIQAILALSTLALILIATAQAIHHVQAERALCERDGAACAVRIEAMSEGQL